MNKNKTIKKLKEEIIKLFDNNDEFIKINSLGLKYFDFTFYYNNNYINYKVDFKNKKYKVVNSNNKNYNYIKFSTFKLIEDIVNIYDTIVK